MYINVFRVRLNDKRNRKKRLRILRNEDAIFCLKRRNDNEKFILNTNSLPWSHLTKLINKNAIDK